jgi:hypothetical protein
MKYLLYPHSIDNHSTLSDNYREPLYPYPVWNLLKLTYHAYIFTWFIYLLKIWIRHSLAYFLKLIYLTNTRYKVPTHVKHSLDFSFVFSAPLPARRNLFSASGIFCGGGYQPGYTGSSDQWKVPASLSLFLKVKNSNSALCRKTTWAQVLPWFSTYYLGLLALAQVSNHRRAWVQALLLYQIPHVCNNCQFETTCECSSCLQSQ